MKVIDRIMLIALVTGVWALVLKPGTPSAHHEGADHVCCAEGESCASNYTEIHHHHATDEIVNYQYASNENRR